MVDINIGGKTYTAEEIEGLKTLLGIGQKHDVSTTTQGMQLPHGTQPASIGGQGLFTRPGGDPNVFSAIRSPAGGLVAALYAGASVITTPEYDILTGVDAGSGSSTDACGTPAQAGLARLCTQRASFGHWRMGTETIDLSQVGQRLNYADMDANVVNMPDFAPFIPDVARGVANINTPLGLAMLRLGVAATRSVEPVLFTGLSGTQSGAWVSQFDGFDQLIKTGHVDLETGTACNAADSIIKNRAGLDVTDTSNNIVTQISGIYRQLERRAEQTGLNPVVIDVVMHPDLFEALSRVWVQTYYTESALNYTTSTIGMTNTSEATQMRWSITNGSVLPIRGRMVRVWQSDFVPVENSGNGMASDIYFVPRTVLAGTPVTYVEAFDMNNAAIREFMQYTGDGGVQVLNNGLYMMATSRTQTCIQSSFASRMRLIMRTPWLAARLTNVGFTLSDGYQDDAVTTTSAYYKNGGRYSSRAPYTA